MEMPKSCAECKLFGEYGCPFVGAVGYALTRGERNEDCPLVPVPPHGDLIDRDAYEKLLRGLGSRDYRREKGTISDAIKFLHPHYTPAIIPAEEGELQKLERSIGDFYKRHEAEGGE